MWFQDEEWVGRVRGALMVSFHTYKAYRDQMAEDGVTFDDPVRKPIAPAASAVMRPLCVSCAAMWNICARHFFVFLPALMSVSS